MSIVNEVEVSEVHWVELMRTVEPPSVSWTMILIWTPDRTIGERGSVRAQRVWSSVTAVATEIAVVIVEMSSIELENPMKEGRLLMKFVTETFLLMGVLIGHLKPMEQIGTNNACREVCQEFIIFLSDPFGISP